MCMYTITLGFLHLRMFLHLPKLSGLNGVPTPVRVTESWEQEQKALYWEHGFQL